MLRAWCSQSLHTHVHQTHVQVDVAAVPPGISLATAEAVLFIGKAARVLRRLPGGPDPGQRRDQALSGGGNPALQPCGAGQAGAAHGKAGHKQAAGAGVWGEAGSAGAEWEGMRQRWAAELRRLAAAPAFSALEFERAVGGLRTQARQLLRFCAFRSQHALWYLLVAEQARVSVAASRPCTALCNRVAADLRKSPFTPLLQCLRCALGSHENVRRQRGRCGAWWARARSCGRTWQRSAHTSSWAAAICSRHSCWRRVATPAAAPVPIAPSVLTGADRPPGGYCLAAHVCSLPGSSGHICCLTAAKAAGTLRSAASQGSTRSTAVSHGRLPGMWISSATSWQIASLSPLTSHALGLSVAHMWQARTLLALPPRPSSAEADANAAFQAAAASCDAATDRRFAGVRLRFSADGAAAHAPVRPAFQAVEESCRSNKCARFKQAACAEAPCLCSARSLCHGCALQQFNVWH